MLRPRHDLKNLVEPCVICGSTQYNGRWDFSKTHGFAVYECAQCGLGRTVPPPYRDEEEADVYQGGDIDERPERKALWRSFAEPLLAEAEAIEIRLTKSHSEKPRGRLLDIGCHVGILVELAEEQGWEAYGVEINRVIAQYARDRLGLRVHDGDVISAAYPNAFFDVIVMSQLLEHIVDPTPLLREVRRILKEHTGILIVSSPNMDGLVVPIEIWYAKLWYGFQPTEHVWQFTPRTLSKLLEKFGFEILHISVRHNLHYTFKPTLLGIAKRVIWTVAEQLNRADNVIVTCRKRIE